MARRVFLIGAGQIGSAVAERLLLSGCRVTVATRGVRGLPAGIAGHVEAVELDRDAPGALAEAIGRGTDVVIDTIAYNDRHADQLLSRRGDVGAFVVVSSASVYADAEGRSLDRSQGKGFPELPQPVTETQATVPAGPATYASRKRAMELRMLEAGASSTVIRPCAVHGPEARDPREWWLMKRLLDGRAAIPLAFDGASRFHPSATANIAELVDAALARPADRVLNAVDPDCPTVAEIAHAVMAATGRFAELVPLPGERRDHVGTTPWSVPQRFVLSDDAARAIGYAPVVDYAAGVVPACRWLMEQVPPDDWEASLTGLTKYPYDLFDYAGEDRWLGARARAA